MWVWVDSSDSLMVSMSGVPQPHQFFVVIVVVLAIDIAMVVCLLKNIVMRNLGSEIDKYRFLTFSAQTLFFKKKWERKNPGIVTDLVMMM